MARPNTLDPLDKFRWIVQIEDDASNVNFSRGGFTTCGTPSYTINTKTYAEGGAHLTPKKIIDTISYKPVVLTRGVTQDPSFNKWATGFIDLVQNNAVTKKNDKIEVSLSNAAALGSAALSGALDKGANSVPSNSGKLDSYSYRRTVKIFHLNRQANAQVVYILYNAFPTDYKPASDFDANADDGLSMESLTIEYESFEVKYTNASVIGAIGNIIAGQFG